jgi:regulator of sirC expression with transglutaminase-like and TPR domain
MHREPCDANILQMTENLARERFLEVVRGTDDEIDLAEAALWIAAESVPDVNVAEYCQRLDELAEAVRQRIESCRDDRHRVSVLNEFLFHERGFRGNPENYYDPRNSYLNDVLDRTTGIPITLSIIWIAVARRLGMDARGIGFPGHFLAMLDSAPPILIDAFSGRLVDEAECRKRLRDDAGANVPFDSSMLVPATSRQILARVLRNLKQIHMQGARLWDALSCADRILALEPDEPVEVRDRGLLYRALECWSPAISDLERFLELMPEANEADQIRKVLTNLKTRTTTLH